jgi:hypothetical protein
MLCLRAPKHLPYRYINGGNKSTGTCKQWMHLISVSVWVELSGTGIVIGRVRYGIGIPVMLLTYVCDLDVCWCSSAGLMSMSCCAWLRSFLFSFSRSRQRMLKQPAVLPNLAFGDLNTNPVKLSARKWVPVLLSSTWIHLPNILEHFLCWEFLNAEFALHLAG